ncbi:MAG: SAM-dependent methyltransferase, partial [Pseudomonadota bacterium]
RSRDESYALMVEHLLAALNTHERVVALFYGHPGVFVWPSHELIRQARAVGHEASMLPGISAEDCLVADLGIDPGVSGLQTYEACDFLVYPRRFDPNVPLVLWQLAVLGDLSRSTFITQPEWVDGLARLLIRSYPATHAVAVYEAASFPLDDARIEWVPLNQLADVRMTQASTLYVPPMAAPDIDRARLRELGLDAAALAEAGFQKARRQ